MNTPDDATPNDDLLPLYHRVKERLRAEIKSGRYCAGALIPSESELCKDFGVSRITVRRALADLVAEGHLIRARGRGTFVARPKIERNLMGDVSFAREMMRMGYVPEARDVKVTLEPPCERTCSILGLADSDEIVRVVRVQLVDGEPVTRQDTQFLHDLCPPDMDVGYFASAPVFVILEDACGLKFTRVRTTVEPVLAGEEDGRLLECQPGSACFRVEQVIYAHGVPSVLNRSLVRGDRCKLVVDMNLQPA